MVKEIDFGLLKIQDLESGINIITENTIINYLKARQAIALIKNHVLVDFKDLYEYLE